VTVQIDAHPPDGQRFRQMGMTPDGVGMWCGHGVAR